MCGGAGPSTTALDAEEQSFLLLLNEHRVANGASPVAACTSLSRAAQGHSEDMRDQNYFDHSGLNGSSPGDRACDACYASCEVTGWGENIAAGNSGAQGTFDQWVSSPGHNANMLNPGFAVVGIGRATGGGPTEPTGRPSSAGSPMEVATDRRSASSSARARGPGPD